MALSKINTGGIEDDAITSAKIGTDVIIAEDIAANAVTASELQDSAVTTAKIAPGGVTGVKIAGGAISAPLMGPASVTGPAIGPGAVGTSNIAAGAVTAPTIGPGAVTAPAIGAGAVDTSNIATGAVTAPTIGPGAVTGPAIGPAAVGTSNIAADAITQPLIGPGAVGSTELGTASVTAPKIGPGAVTNAAIGAGAVTTTELGPAAVTAPIIGPGAVGSTQLATNAVTTVKITDANITAPKIGSGAVTAPAIGTGAVTAPAIGPNAIGAPAIGPGAVGTSQLASDVSISTSGDISMGDNAKVQFGASNDLQIYHDGSNSYISDQGTGNLRIQATNFEVANAAYTKSYIVATDGAEVTLKYNNDNKLTTTSGGVTVTGTVNADGISLGDNDVLNFGASNDLQISHDGNNSLIADTGTGDLFIRGSNNIYLQNAGGTTMLRLASGAGNYLYYNGSSKLETTSAGATVTGTLSATAFSGDGSALTGIGGGITEADEWRLTSSAT